MAAPALPDRKKVTIIWNEGEPEVVEVDSVEHKDGYVILHVNSDLDRLISMSAVKEIKIEPKT